MRLGEEAALKNILVVWYIAAQADGGCRVLRRHPLLIREQDTINPLSFLNSSRRNARKVVLPEDEWRGLLIIF